MEFAISFMVAYTGMMVVRFIVRAIERRRLNVDASDSEEEHLD